MKANERLSSERDHAYNPTILIVATNVSVLKMLKLALVVEYQGEVLGTSSGREALETTRRLRPDLVVIYSQPIDLNALKLADQLHDIASCESMPIILTHTSITMSHANQRPYLHVLRVPYALEDLYAAIHTCLDCE